ncbi:hypothetical protein PENTCL1PPCAC_18502 [Pristionchus entomophagus]|uniref:Calpain catalytic domain-containing protein n=1 Tax=Pristionchus entomophagus TaxID=358040 RepID=A0AAV5TPM9_9BILA|nr:hypothetical protein PENTCL1PPCAC_18502 [Pristionchus entomophagus]
MSHLHSTQCRLESLIFGLCFSLDMSDEEGYYQEGEYVEGGGYDDGGDGEEYYEGEDYQEPEPEEEVEEEEVEEEAVEEEAVEEEEDAEAEEVEEEAQPEEEYDEEPEPEELAPEDYQHDDSYDGDNYVQPEFEATAEEAEELVAAAATGDLESIDDSVPAAIAHKNYGSADGDEPPKTQHASMFKGVLDGFGGGGMSGIIGEIQNITGGGGGGSGGGMMTNLLASGALGGMVEKAITAAAGKFFNVDPSTGALIGAIAGNLIFNRGGCNNSLGGMGKMILENIMNGKFRRDITPWTPPVPGATSFNLDFHAERDRCLREKRLFEDPEFPACDRSIYFKERPTQTIEWKRPSDIVDNPQLIVEGHSRFDVKQGALGDCWLLAAVANLTLRDELFYRVVPPDQSFTENYAGIFHFQFWRYGKWVDVVIDDMLPTVNGKLYYMHSAEHNEFWSALLEKAYAKLYGSYENLEGGSTAEALEDFTGGLTESFDLKKTEAQTILAMLVRGFQMGSLFGCSIAADPNIKEAICPNGLVRGHAYSITALHTVKISRGDQVMLRIRNPWGNSDEWNGPWSDGDVRWEDVSEDQKRTMQVTFKKDGEFWIAFEDFMREYKEMEVCNLSAEVMNEICEMTGVDQMCTSSGRNVQWKEVQQDGAWSIAEKTAGGCANHPRTYWHNPQFGSRFTVTGESVEHDGKCTIIVAVLQKYRRELRVENKDSLPIGFSIYQAPALSQALDEQFFRSNKSIARTPVFIDLREVTVRFRAEPGEYIIVPCAFEPNTEAEFLMRVFVNGEVQTGRLPAYH